MKKDVNEIYKTLSDIDHTLLRPASFLGSVVSEKSNQYILEGLRNNKPSNLSLDEIDGLLAHDKPEGNNLRKFANLINNSSEIDEVKEKKETYRGL